MRRNTKSHFKKLHPQQLNQHKNLAVRVRVSGRGTCAQMEGRGSSLGSGYNSFTNEIFIPGRAYKYIGRLVARPWAREGLERHLAVGRPAARPAARPTVKCRTGNGRPWPRDQPPDVGFTRCMDGIRSCISKSYTHNNLTNTTT